MGTNKLIELTEKEGTGDSIVWEREYSSGRVKRVELGGGGITVYEDDEKVGSSTITTLFRLLDGKQL